MSLKMLCIYLHLSYHEGIMIYAIWTALNLYLQFAVPHNSHNSPSVNTNCDANQYTSAHP